MQEIHNGILDFSKIYKNFFKKDPYILNISGYDAYCPYRMIIKNLKWIKKFFDKIAFARGISGDGKIQKIETIGDLVKQAKV